VQHTGCRWSSPTRVLITGLALALLSCEAAGQSKRDRQLYLVPYSHTDVGYTAPVETVLAAHQRYLDTVIAYCARSAALPPESRFKWTVEVTWPLEAYLASRSASEVESLMSLVRAGSIEIGAMHFSLQTDLCGNEELIRSLSFAQRLRDGHGVTIRCALINDTPGFTRALPELFTRAEIPYFAVAMNSFLSNFYSTTTLPQLFYWQGASSSRVLVWRCLDKQWAYLEGAFSAGVYSDYATFSSKLETALTYLELIGYPYDDVLINCATGDNGPPNYAVVDNVTQWNQTHTTTRVRIATASEFFDTVSTKYGPLIPVYSGDGPNWWSWMFASSATKGMAVSRRVQTHLPEAEAWAAIAGAVDRTYAYPGSELEHAYTQNLLFEDHNLGATDASGNIPYWTLKMAWIDSARALAEQTRQSALATIAAQIPTASENVVAVFNGLGWSRSDIVSIPLSDPILSGLGPVDIVDAASGAPALSQVLSDGTVAFLARDVPSFGYRIYRLIPNPTRPWGARQMSGSTLENDDYRVAVKTSTCGISSLYDKQASRELTSGTGQFNQYRYNGSQLPAGYAIAASDSGLLLQQLTLQGSAPGSSSYATTVSLLAGIRQVRFTHRYQKSVPASLESVDFMFETSMNDGHVRYEIPFGDVRLFDQELSGFRVNHYGIGRWLNVASAADDFNLTLSSEVTPIAAFSSGSFNGPVRLLSSYNDAASAYRAGTGNMDAAFTVTSAQGTMDAVRAMTFGHGSSVPLRALTLPAGRNGLLPPDFFSYIRTASDNKFISTLKRSSNGDGTIVRIYDPEGTQGQDSILLWYPLEGPALATTLLERDLRSAGGAGKAVPFTCEGYDVQTFRLRVSEPSTGVAGMSVPEGFKLEQNFPNPFNIGTTIRFSVGQAGRARLTVRNILGETVYAWPDHEVQPGIHSVIWNAVSSSGWTVASGVYFYTVEAHQVDGSTVRSTRPMILLK
jgi:hypothetical protein